MNRFDAKGLNEMAQYLDYSQCKDFVPVSDGHNTIWIPSQHTEREMELAKRELVHLHKWCECGWNYAQFVSTGALSYVPLPPVALPEGNEATRRHASTRPVRCRR